jgi:hypothetical protein
MINKITLIIERNVSNKKIISEDLEYHILNDVGVDKNVFRPGSQKFFDLFAEARELNKKGLYKLNRNEKYYINETDIGEWGIYEGDNVPLDYPIVEGEEDEIAKLSERAKRKKKKSKKKKTGNVYQGKKVELNKPKRGGSKKYYVYVKDPKTGNIKKVSFGAKGMSVGLNDPKRVKSFVARHRCKTHANDKTKAAYWSCRLPRYFGNSGKKWW